MTRPVKINTTVANLGISAAPAFFKVADVADLMGLSATNGTGAPYYVKLYWTGQQNISYAQLSAVLTNAACTIVPTMVVEVPQTTGIVWGPNQWPIAQAGPLYLWAVSTAADATNTSLASGGDVITVFID